MLIGRGYVMGWGALALLNAGVAQGKNRSGLNWFLLSLLLVLATRSEAAGYRRIALAAATSSLTSRSRVGP